MLVQCGYDDDEAPVEEMPRGYEGTRGSSLTTWRDDQSAISTPKDLKNTIVYMY